MFGLPSLELEGILHFLNHHRQIANLVVFLVSFFESLAVIGLVTPGAVTMGAIGFLMSTSVLSVGGTLTCAISGAVLGDVVSYLFGRYLESRIRIVWPFTKWPQLVAQSEQYFAKHGGKSVFVCRFLGPLRAMIPMIAGAFQLPLQRFLLAAVPAATIWSIAYMLPGVLLGVASLTVPLKWLAIAIVVVILVALLGLLLLWGVYRAWICLNAAMNRCADYWWQHLSPKRIFARMADPDHLNSGRQLKNVILGLLGWVLFLWIWYQLFYGKQIAELNKVVYHLSSHMRCDWLDSFFALMTSLGDFTCWSIFLLISSAYLWMLGGVWGVVCWWGSILSADVVLLLLKLFSYYPRPGSVLYQLDGAAFPSAHMASSVIVYGFLGLILAENSGAKRRTWWYGSILLLLVLVGFSRVYLGAHWMADVIGGGLLGLVSILIGSVVYRSKSRRASFEFTRSNFVRGNGGNSIVFIIIFLLVWIGYGWSSAGLQKERYRPLINHRFVNVEQWLAGESPSFNLQRVDFLGRPAELLNFVYIGQQLFPLQLKLQQHGWKVLSPSVQQESNLLSRLVSGELLAQHTMLAGRHENRPLALVMTKSIADDSLRLRLWPANLLVVDGKEKIWVGHLEYYQPNTAPSPLKKIVARGERAAADLITKMLAHHFIVHRRCFSSLFPEELIICPSFDSEHSQRSDEVLLIIQERKL